MAIELFDYNQKAYDDASLMLLEERKAAIIHPTGTGKSFIGFKFVEEHSDWHICWLSSSDYIFQTQLENIGHKDGYDNLTFITYSKLIKMSMEDLGELHPDLIIMDEFHRAGASEWGKAVTALLELYPETMVLGLSATNIRYLDNQRNMADELFDGNVASQMTLGEAIVRGILKAPKYVISLYSYEEEILAYEEKIENAKNQIAKDEAMKYLEILKRKLEQSMGLSEVFSKHITNRNSRFIVFCSGYKHMQEMIEKSKEWFAPIDKVMHIYSAYANDPMTSQEFIDFQKDDSDHLKLLFCIDMLNEGIHVKDIDGVILFRPTVSPIIYRQQIGRAMSAFSSKNPIIFDIVNNFEAIHSIDGIQEEIDIAVNYYHMMGMDNEIEVEDFQIDDEVRDFIDIFEKMDESLSASWDLMYNVAKDYYLKHGDLEVPKAYQSEEGYNLGLWISTQRRVYNHTAKGSLSQERIDKLNAIGMRFDNVNDMQWHKYYTALKKYHDVHGDININSQYVSDDGLMLGRWLTRMRSYYGDGIKGHILTPERIEALNDLGMIWDYHSKQWDENYDAAKKYYEEHGDLNIPKDYKSEKGVLIKTWLNNMKNKYNKGTLMDEQKRLLEDIGMCFESSKDVLWYASFNKAKQYFEEHGNLNVPSDYKCADGFALGRWIRRHRQDASGKTQIKVTEERKELLDSIGMIWSIEKVKSSDKYLNACREYYKEYGNLKVYGNVTYKDIDIGQWLSRRRLDYSRGELSQEMIDELNDIGMLWQSSKEYRWQQKYNLVKQHYQQYHDFNMDDKSLNLWIKQQVNNYKLNLLTNNQKVLLDSINIQEYIENNWNNYYLKAKDYYESYHDLNILSSYVCEDGTRLGQWLFRQRQLYRENKLTKDKIEKLNDIHIVWDKITQTKWFDGFNHAREFYNEYKHLDVNRDYVSNDGYKLGQWINGQRKRYRNNLMSEEQETLLNSVHMIWNIYEYKWNLFYQKAVDYKNEFGDLNIPATYKTQDGEALGVWIRTQRRAYNKDN
ncbi:MAG: Helicase associated domain protein, partial [Erysipelotrichaceae bacterium]|nr:Helicase associated domain protein [Erysipelotrichaceae bacterium]